MKRRVANLPPVAATAFNEKVMERREQNAVRTDPRDMACVACRYDIVA
jgi:pre-60S factor REI1